MRKPNPNPRRKGTQAAVPLTEMNRRMEEYLARNDMKPKLVEEIQENGMVIKRYEDDPYLMR